MNRGSLIVLLGVLASACAGQEPVDGDEEAIRVCMPEDGPCTPPPPQPAPPPPPVPPAARAPYQGVPLLIARSVAQEAIEAQFPAIVQQLNSEGYGGTVGWE